MAGRPRKMSAVSKGKIGKEKREYRQLQEQAIKVNRDDLVPPSWLSFRAKKEFKRVVKAAEKLDVLDDLDLAVLVIYAHSYDQYQLCSELVMKHGVTAEREGQTSTYEVLSPYVSAQEKYAKQIMQCSTKLGLATTDRLKLIVPEPPEEENKFLKYVK